MSDTLGSAATRKTIVTAVGIAACQIGGAGLLALARRQGMVTEETAVRGAMALIGLGIAAYGNMMPKTLGTARTSSVRAVALGQAVSRVGGWAMVLMGCVYAALWAFAPRSVAAMGCLAAAGLAAATMVGYAAWRVVAYRRSSAS